MYLGAVDDTEPGVTQTGRGKEGRVSQGGVQSEVLLFHAEPSDCHCFSPQDTDQHGITLRRKKEGLWEKKI